MKYRFNPDAELNNRRYGDYTPARPVQPSYNVGGKPIAQSSGIVSSDFDTNNPAASFAPAANPSVQEGGIASSVGYLQQPTTEELSIQDYIKQMQDAQRTSRIAALDKYRTNASSALDTQEAGIDPAYYNRKNTVAANSDIGAMNFAQFMASRGIKGASGAMPEIYRNNALQGNLGELERQQQGEHDQIARNRAGIETNYQADVAAANADIDAQGLQAYINQMNADRAYRLQEADLTGNLGGTPTLAARQFQTSVDQWNTTNAQQMEQQKLDNLYRQKVFDYNVSRDAVADSHWQQQMNLDMRRQTFSEAQAKIENSFRSQQITQQEKDRALQWAKFNADQDPTSLDNQLKQSQLDLNAYSKGNAVLNDAIQRLDSMYLTKNPVTGAMARNTNFSDEQLRSAIIGLGLDDPQTDALLLRYGLPINQ